MIITMSMKEFLDNVIFPALGITFRILFITMVLSIVFGLVVGIALAVTDKDGLRPNRIVYKILEFSTNLVRSFPFIILIVSLMPLTRIIIGTSIGESAAILPLTVALSPYLGRLIESHLKEVDRELVDAARSYGASDWQIIWHVLLVQATPGIISVICFTVIAGLNATTQAGLVGAGGIGSVAIRYGYQNFNNTIMYSTVLIIIVIVQTIQWIGNMAYKKLK